MKQLKTEDIYLGIRYDYVKTFFSKGEHTRAYDAFYKTDLGYKSITNNKIYPNYEEYHSIPKNMVAYLEPMLNYFDTNSWLTKKEILHFIKEQYISLKQAEEEEKKSI